MLNLLLHLFLTNKTMLTSCVCLSLICLPPVEATSLVFVYCGNHVSHRAHGTSYKHPCQDAPPVSGCFQEVPFWQFQDLKAFCWGLPFSPSHFCISSEGFHEWFLHQLSWMVLFYNKVLWWQKISLGWVNIDFCRICIVFEGRSSGSETLELKLRHFSNFQASTEDAIVASGNYQFLDSHNMRDRIIWKGQEHTMDMFVHRSQTLLCQCVAQWAVLIYVCIWIELKEWYQNSFTEPLPKENFCKKCWHFSRKIPIKIPFMVQMICQLLLRYKCCEVFFIHFTFVYIVLFHIMWIMNIYVFLFVFHI